MIAIKILKTKSKTTMRTKLFLLTLFILNSTFVKLEKNDDSNAIVLVDTEKDTNDKRAEVIVSDKIEGLLFYFIAELIFDFIF